MASGARELLKWLALVLMTGDHVAKVLYGGYVPIVSELGRIAFPLFALVLAYNLAQPGADLAKSVRRLLVWGLIAHPVYVLAFGQWLPLNVLLTFALAATALCCIQGRRWALLTACMLPAPFFVDYQWSGVLLVLAGWYCFRARCGRMRCILVCCACAPLCAYNGNGWALLALPVMLLVDVTRVWSVAIPRMRWAFYVYYVAHLAMLAALHAAWAGM
ncbi:TraX family protein [Xanthomonas theicola]|uniref:Conjugal transfer protein n=1 Tax=Xanthomonas theicola TaxID=56464 RepID=A0A2S6Z5U6_9XANT|nr:TraX family protein [Xanthomonas theicola]PPT76863.1 conjugal transfer protein [Xanthomonas theicola]QNH24714.1 conjugal transfer protein [Xanthomonas theicola]